MKKYVLALDEGTTSARAVVFDAKGKVVSVRRESLRRSIRKRVGSSTTRWKFTLASTAL